VRFFIDIGGFKTHSKPGYVCLFTNLPDVVTVTSLIFKMATQPVRKKQAGQRITQICLYSTVMISQEGDVRRRKWSLDDMDSTI
jgi:hypothetical protein